MAASVNIHEAKTHFSKLVRRAEEGEEIVVRRGATPAAKLVPIEPSRRAPRELGGWEGKLWVAPDEEAVDREVERLFAESEIFPEDKH